MVITAASHPLLHKACETIFHDNGGGAGHPSYEIPEAWEPLIDVTERALATLSENEFETFCIGEESEMKALVDRSSELKAADSLLAAFFDEYL